VKKYNAFSFPPDILSWPTLLKHNKNLLVSINHVPAAQSENGAVSISVLTVNQFLQLRNNQLAV